MWICLAGLVKVVSSCFSSAVRLGWTHFAQMLEYSRAMLRILYRFVFRWSISFNLIRHYESPVHILLQLFENFELLTAANFWDRVWGSPFLFWFIKPFQDESTKWNFICLISLQNFMCFCNFFFLYLNKTWYSFFVPCQVNTAYARSCCGWTNWAKAVD
jgi:hypothetical protein